MAPTRSELIIPIGLFIIGLMVGGIAMNRRPISSGKIFDADREKITWRDEVIATHLEIPWDLAEASSGKILFTERTGKLKSLELSDGKISTLAEIPVATVSESGLTGLALHPNYGENHQLYVYYTFRRGGELLNRVVRYALNSETLADEKIIIDNLPGGQIHNGGRLRFGPDKKLYIQTGDAARQSIAQDRGSLGGKILRLNDDGSIPQDNPFSDSPIYTTGHRNPQGLDWHPLTEDLYSSEHGETAHDEINKILPGQDYGWPQTRPNSQNPVASSNIETWAPSGLAFYGTKIWGLRNTMFVGSLRGQQLLRFDIVDGKVVKEEKLLRGKYGRIRAVLVIGDGTMIISTSNRDGRAKPVPEDDRLIRLTPLHE